MEIHEMLRRLANIQEKGYKKEKHQRFFDSLTMEDLANLGGYGMVLQETTTKIATNRILKGDQMQNENK